MNKLKIIVRLLALNIAIIAVFIAAAFDSIPMMLVAATIAASILFVAPAMMKNKVYGILTVALIASVVICIYTAYICSAPAFLAGLISYTITMYWFKHKEIVIQKDVKKSI